MFRMLATAGAATTLLALPACGAAAAEAAPEVTTSDVTIQVLNANGSGCPSGSAVGASTSGNEFTLTYPSFSTPGGSSSNCLTLVRVGAPAGWTFTISKMVNMGSAQLDPSATGTFSMLARFTGFAWSMVASKTIPGPYDGTWNAETFTNTPVWAPCNEQANTLILDHTISAVGPASSSLTLLGSTTGHVDLRRC